MNQFESDIRKKLSGFEAEPPQDMWSKIESRLDNKPTLWVVYRRRVMAAAAVLLIVLSGSLLLITGIGTDPVQLTQESTAPSDQPVPDATPPTSIPGPYDQPHEITIEAGSSITDQHSSTLLAQEVKPEATIAAEPSEKVMFVSENRILASIPGLSATVDQQVNRHSIATWQPVFEQSIATITEESSLTLASVAETNIPGAFSFSAYFAPQQAYRYHLGNMINPVQGLESEILTFSSGILAAYKINNRWQIESGIGYNRLGQQVNDIASFSHPSMMPLYTSNGTPISEHPQSMSTSMGGIVFTDQSFYFADVSSARIITLKGSYDESIVNLLNKTGMGLVQYFEYLEIPVNARYKILDRGLTVHTTTGIALNYLLTGDVYLAGKTQATPIGKSVGINTLNFSGSAGIAFSYPVADRVRVSLEPRARVFLNSMGPVRNLTRETYPYTFSVFMGLSYDL